LPNRGVSAQRGVACRADLPVLVRSAKALPRGGNGSDVPDRRGPSDRLTAGALLAIRVPIGPAAA
jgi:hypothetical protein